MFDLSEWPNRFISVRAILTYNCQIKKEVFICKLANLFAQLGKVPVPAQLGKLFTKKPEIGKIRVVKSSYWEIGVFEFLLPNTFKLITKCYQVVNIIFT